MKCFQFAVFYDCACLVVSVPKGCSALRIAFFSDRPFLCDRACGQISSSERSSRVSTFVFATWGAARLQVCRLDQSALRLSVVQRCQRALQLRAFFVVDNCLRNNNSNPSGLREEDVSVL